VIERESQIGLTTPARTSLLAVGSSSLSGDTDRFCSHRCRDAYDNGLPHCEELPSAGDMIGVDTSLVPKPK